MNNPKQKESSGNDIYTTDYSEYLPEPLKKDQKMKALAAALTQQLLGASGSMEKVLIYSKIDKLPEELVDILSYDMHVDWYDYSYPLDIKRDILKNSVKVHKTMGTKYAVEKAIGAVYPESKVEEWFQYGGRPHYFRVVLDVTRADETPDIETIKKKIALYKRLSSHLEEIVLIDNQTAQVQVVYENTIGFETEYQGKGNYYPLLLGGGWKLDGSFKLNGLKKGSRKDFYEVEMKASCDVTAEIEVKGEVTVEKNLWFLNGKYKLNGEKRLNAEISKEEI